MQGDSGANLKKRNAITYSGQDACSEISIVTEDFGTVACFCEAAGGTGLDCVYMHANISLKYDPQPK